MTTAKTAVTKNTKSPVEELVEEAKKPSRRPGAIPVQETVTEETPEVETEEADSEETVADDAQAEDEKVSKVQAAKAKLKSVFANKKVIISAAATFVVGAVALAVVNSLQNSADEEAEERDENEVDDIEETPSA